MFNLRIDSSLDSSNFESYRKTFTGIGGFFIPDGDTAFPLADPEGEPDFNLAPTWAGSFN